MTTCTCGHLQLENASKRASKHCAGSAYYTVIKNNLVVGHVPCNLASLFFYFLRKSCNKGTAEVTGDKVNRGAGYGLEIPCKYRLYGPEFYIKRVKILAQVD